MSEFPGCTVKPRNTMPSGGAVTPLDFRLQVLPPSVLLNMPNSAPSPLVPDQTMSGLFGSNVRLKMGVTSPVGPPRAVMPWLEGRHVAPASSLRTTPAKLSVTYILFLSRG